MAIINFSGGNNPFYGKHHSKESKKRMSLAKKGKHLSPNTEFKKGFKPFFSDEHKKKISNSLKGRKHSEETKRKIGEKSKGRKHTEEFKKRMGEFFRLNNPMKNSETAKKISQIKTGVKRSSEMKKKLSETRKRKFASGELIVSEEAKKKLSEKMSSNKNPMWKGGKSFEPYTSDFNHKIKKIIQKRDKETCQLCNKNKKELNEALVVHHINYNKKDSSLNNLITLCNICHSKTNIKRDYWQEFFKIKINNSS